LLSPPQDAMKVTIFEYNVVWVARKTLDISVLPDGSVRVRAPLGTERDQIERRLLARSDWIRRQMDYFQGFDPRSTPRSFVAGESHLFLGKSYRLKLSENAEESVTLQGGWLMISTSDPDPMTIKILLRKWYQSQAKRIFPPQLEREWKRVVPVGGLCQGWSSRRWGVAGGVSLVVASSPSTSIHPRSKALYRIVLCHELCHLEHRAHGPEFMLGCPTDARLGKEEVPP